ncbi:MAG: hypothetical protein KDC38_12425 [Planctomycetes bacterium]|nr:hypothetical protein [Planctomycetota bacterium]
MMMSNSRPREESSDAGGDGVETYGAPAIEFEQVIEAVANTCNFDPPLTKASAAEGCTGLTFS